MKKLLTYSGFLIACLIVTFTFVTAKTYTQLAIATVLYPFVAYFAYHVFVHRKISIDIGGAALAQPSGLGVQVARHPSSEPGEKSDDRSVVDVVDVDRRAFLKIIGATGLSFFLFSLLGRRAETLLFDKAQDVAVSPPLVTPSAKPTDKYRISEVDDVGITAFYGFTGPDGSWFIMRENADEGTFRYVKGDSDFSGNWGGRENLEYNYFHEVF